MRNGKRSNSRKFVGEWRESVFGEVRCGILGLVGLVVGLSEAGRVLFGCALLKGGKEGSPEGKVEFHGWWVGICCVASMSY